ncbi:(2Fe-2S)-binding protein [Pseudomonas viridiflava]|uniref:(2Fe-2S)-binding protein n=1 Tax=Pseudomonas viridiflava TaxID=33069 RepID=UPI0018E5B611|nr:(2Fe-2S)-binding protein [Pseudomonas viridiflava]
MYVCLCQGVSDKTIQKAIDEGCRTVTQIRDSTGAASQCCKCVPEIRKMINAAATEAPPGNFYAVGVGQCA